MLFPNHSIPPHTGQKQLDGQSTSLYSHLTRWTAALHHPNSCQVDGIIIPMTLASIFQTQSHGTPACPSYLFIPATLWIVWIVTIPPTTPFTFPDALSHS